MSLEFLPQKKIKSIDVTTWKEFKTALNNWVCFEGPDYCPDCFNKFVEKFRDNETLKKAIKIDAKPTIELLNFRKIADGWLVECNDCGKNVFRPIPKEE